MTSPESAVRFGVFSLGGTVLALPMEALREVIPCRELARFPNPAPCVVGAINLRDVLVPVVDLRLLLNQPIKEADFPCVIVMVHEGKILGLLADAVIGIFSDKASSVHRVVVSDPVSAVLQGSIHWEEADTLVNLLSPHAIASLSQLPMVNDPEPHRQRVENHSEEVVIRDESRPLMLVRCGYLPLAIDAMAVHTTVSDVEVFASPLSMGHCLGVMHYAGLKVPAVDLQALCGMGRADTTTHLSQAFILSLPQGFVACLVSEVVDVVRVQADALVKLPGFSLKCPDFFEAALPMSVLPQEVARRTGLAVNQYLLMDAKHLQRHEELLALSQTNVPAGRQFTDVGAVTGVKADAIFRPMITYTLMAETASPLDQIVEILPYARESEIFDSGSELLGLMINRGRSIPVMCLRSLMGGEACQPSASTSVLVVAANDQYVGFAISQLKSIETAVWEPGLPSAMNSGGMASMGAASKLAQMGQGTDARMMPVIDLVKLAMRLSHQQDAHEVTSASQADFVLA